MGVGLGHLVTQEDRGISTNSIFFFSQSGQDTSNTNGAKNRKNKHPGVFVENGNVDVTVARDSTIFPAASKVILLQEGCV